MVLTSRTALGGRRAALLRRRGVELIAVRGRGPRLDLRAALEALADHCGARRVLVEGGGRLGVGLLRLGLVDRLHLLMAPAIMGDEHLRELEREATGGSVQAQAELLKARVRAGQLAQEAVHLAAYLGHEPAYRAYSVGATTDAKDLYEGKLPSAVRDWALAPIVSVSLRSGCGRNGLPVPSCVVLVEAVCPLITARVFCYGA